jgi:hypothetical protein
MNPEIEILPSNIAVSEMYSNISAKRAKKKEEKQKKKEVKKAEKAQKRSARKLTKQQRKDERKHRRELRRQKRKGGIPLSADELADEELDMNEAKADGDTSEASDMSKEAKDSEENDYEGDEGMPTWAKWTIGITAGAGIIGLATWGIVSAMKKKA